MREVSINSSENLLCRAEVAENLWNRGWGLLGRRGLPADRGLWIKSCNSVHTAAMRFPVDLVYLAEDGTVVKTCSQMRPFRLSLGGRNACSIIELPAGSLHRTRVKVGQKLVFAPISKKATDTSGGDQVKWLGPIAAPQMSRFFAWLRRSGVTITGIKPSGANHNGSQFNSGREARQVRKA